MGKQLDDTSSFYKSDEEVILSLKQVDVTFQLKKTKVTAVSDFSLDIHKGELVCILGPSGCGKTTLLSVIAGILPATGGTVRMGGADIVGMDWQRAIIFQSPTLYPWKSVYENIAFGLKLRKVPKQQIEERVKMYLELVGLEEFTDAKPYELSGGMKQRTALARALVGEPAVILMDEPLGALDAFTRSNMQYLIRDVWKKTGMTALLVTHDINEALALGSRIIVMSGRPGKVLGMFDGMFSIPFNGTEDDDRIIFSDEYISLRRGLLNLINKGM